MSGDFWGDLVALQHVLERFHFHAEPVGDAEEHQDFICPVAVRVDFDVAGKDVRQGFEPEVPPGFGERVGRTLRLLVLIPLLLVTTSFRERTNEHGLDAEAAVREPAVGAFHVFAECEFHSPRPVGDEHFLGGPAELHFHDGVLPTDHVGTTVEQAGGRSAAAQGTVDVARLRNRSRHGRGLLGRPRATPRSHRR